MQYSDNMADNESIEALAGSDNKVICNWEKVDLKDFLTILSLANPPITQTKVAQMLKISPVTLSRVVNSDDRRIREAWIPVLSECLSKVDMERVATTAKELLTISEHITHQKLLIESIPVIEEYISKRGLGYKVDSNYWGISDGIIRFLDAKEESQWLISLGSRRDLESWRIMRSGVGPFFRYRRMQSIAQNDRLSILYHDSESFSLSIKGVEYRKSHQDFYRRGAGLPCYQSLLWRNPQSNQIEEEFVVSDDDEWID